MWNVQFTACLKCIPVEKFNAQIICNNKNSRSKFITKAESILIGKTVGINLIIGPGGLLRYGLYAYGSLNQLNDIVWYDFGGS